MPFTVTLSDSLLRLPQRIDRALAIGREGAALYLAVAIKSQYRADRAVATGATLNAVRTLENRPDLVRVGTDTPQARFIEGGRRPGPVPPWPIFKPMLRQWATARGLGLSDSALYLIARKIRTKGYPARHSVETAANGAADGVARIFQRELAKL